MIRIVRRTIVKCIYLIFKLTGLTKLYEKMAFSKLFKRLFSQLKYSSGLKGDSMKYDRRFMVTKKHHHIV